MSLCHWYRAAGCLYLLRWRDSHDPYWGPALTFKDTTITFALIGYAFVSALLPVWLILAPRDYLATFLKSALSSAWRWVSWC
ncbi:carbon starvation CstA family protein [Escherichia coli]